MFDGVWNGDYKDIREFVATKLPVIEGFHMKVISISGGNTMFEPFLNLSQTNLEHRQTSLTCLIYRSSECFRRRLTSFSASTFSIVGVLRSSSLSSSSRRPTLSYRGWGNTANISLLNLIMLTFLRYLATVSTI